MKRQTFILFHKDHPLHVHGVNSGAEMATLFLAKFFAKSGHRIIVCATLPEGETTHEGVEYWDLGEDFDAKSALRRAGDIGPYHIISAGRAYPLLLSRDEPNCKSRFLISHDPSSNATGISSEILAKTVDKVICVSNAQKELMVKAGMPPEKVVVIYNGVDHDLFSPGSSKVPGKLIFVGALVQDKGIVLLLNAYSELKAKFPHISLDVFGSSSLWKREPLFNERDVEKALPGVRFHGNQNQKVVAEALRKSSLCVIPSIWFDSFPLVSVEAQASGCPVVTFRVGGLPEGISNGETGVVIDDISETALISALSSLLSDEAKIKRMSEAASKVAKDRFRWDKVVDSIVTLCNPIEEIPTKNQTRVGFVTTWNQQCGLATYAKYLSEPFPAGSYVVFAEKLDSAPICPDENFVSRCWKRGDAELGELREAITKSRVKILHLNCHYRFFPQPIFKEFLLSLKEEGITVITHLHSLFTFGAHLQDLISASDGVIVHSPECRLEAIANGASPAKVFIVPHGVHSRKRLSHLEKLALRAKLSLPTNVPIISSFGFVQAHKGMEGLLEGIAYLGSKGARCHAVIAGRPHPDDKDGDAYLSVLINAAKDFGISDRITFVSTFLSDEEVMDYLAASDVVLMNYRSQHYEASGACSLAVGSGAVVATSTAPPFSSFSDAVWHITSGYPSHVSIETLLTNETLRREILRNADAYCHENSWEKTRERLFRIYQSFGWSIAPEMVDSAAKGEQVFGTFDLDESGIESQVLVEKGEIAAKEGKFEEGHRLLEDAIKRCPSLERAWSTQGVIYLAEGKAENALESFEIALSLNSASDRALGGMGMIAQLEGRTRDAHILFLKALDSNPFHHASIRELVRCSYILEQFNDLERCLKKYLTRYEDDADIWYCLAGCLYKLKKFDQASDALDRVFTFSPDHNGLSELKDLILKQRAVSQLLGAQHGELLAEHFSPSSLKSHTFEKPL